jgi:hypothetical protein
MHPVPNGMARLVHAIPKLLGGGAIVAEDTDEQHEKWHDAIEAASWNERWNTQMLITYFPRISTSDVANVSDQSERDIQSGRTRFVGAD